MHLLTEAMNGLGAVLLPVAAGLLLEELTLGGLVRLLLAPPPGARRYGALRVSSATRARGRGELNHQGDLGGVKCLH